MYGPAFSFLLRIDCPKPFVKNLSGKNYLAQVFSTGIKYHFDPRSVSGFPLLAECPQSQTGFRIPVQKYRLNSSNRKIVQYSCNDNFFIFYSFGVKTFLYCFSVLIVFKRVFPFNCISPFFSWSSGASFPAKMQCATALRFDIVDRLMQLRQPEQCTPSLRLLKSATWKAPFNNDNFSFFIGRFPFTRQQVGRFFLPSSWKNHVRSQPFKVWILMEKV